VDVTHADVSRAGGACRGGYDRAVEEGHGMVRRGAMAAALVVATACVAQRPADEPAAADARAFEPPDPAARPGAQADGSILLPNGWRIAPHGAQVALESDLPVRMAWHPGGRFLAIQHAGFRAHEIAILDSVTDTVVARLPVPRSWSGMAWSADGARLFVSGGVDDVVHVFDFDASVPAGKLAASWRVAPAPDLNMPAGMCVDATGRLFVALQRSHRVVRLAADGTVDLDVQLAPESFPFECAARGGLLYVSLWGRGEVAVLDAETGAASASIATGPHPSELLLSPDGARLFVSNANENTVSVIDTAVGRVTETISSSLFPGAPPGSTPNSLALSPDGRTLLVANADNNDVAVIDVAEPGRSRALGFVPVGCYPTSVRYAPDGAHVYVADGKGSAGSRANPKGPQPIGPVPNLDDYTGGMFRGALSVFAAPGEDELRALTARVYACAPLDAAARVRADAGRPAGSPIPAQPGDPSPIRYCVYVIKENRTYDQILGDDPRGDGDASLCIFPAAVTPNHHALASEFVLLDNFYVDAEVSADGHEWSMGAYATDFVERTWPAVYGGKAAVEVANGRPKSLGYPSEGQWALATPKNGYLWDLARAAGVSYRSYGEFVQNAFAPDTQATSSVPALEGHFDPLYRSYDLDYTDVKRAARFQVELDGFERAGEMPRLCVVRLPNDHTAGRSRGKPTPSAYVADNDLALGRLVEGLSKSRFWPQMAVFVVEDDAQNGPDHVDAHRSVCLVAGPWVKRGAVVSAMYSTASVLRTMELILGLAPMSQFDAAARPMYACFAGRADVRPYAHRDATWMLAERNAANAWGAELSASMDLSREDAADDLALNEVIWRSVKGDDAPMPSPRRAAFVRAIGD
jgi:YVTN family beta-propeller protein